MMDAFFDGGAYALGLLLAAYVAHTAYRIAKDKGQKTLNVRRSILTAIAGIGLVAWLYADSYDPGHECLESNELGQCIEHSRDPSVPYPTQEDRTEQFAVLFTLIGVPAVLGLRAGSKEQEEDPSTDGESAVSEEL